ncbi:hypothetical protein ACUY2X_12360 [Corynebacterium minutissimum]
MTRPDSPATNIRLAGVHFDTHEEAVTVHWLLGGLPHHRDVVFTLHTVDLELTIRFDNEHLESMDIASFGEDERDIQRTVDYKYTYTPEALAVTIPSYHFELQEQVFTMALSVDGMSCGEWTGTVI